MSESNVNHDKLISFLENSGVLLIDSVREAFQNIIVDEINKEVEESIKYERKRQAKLLASVFLREGIAKDRMIELLHREWWIEESEAEEIVDRYLNITLPIRAINDYLKEKGYSMSFIREFIENNNVEEQLKNNPSLSDLTTKPEILIQAVNTSNK